MPVFYSCDIKLTFFLFYSKVFKCQAQNYIAKYCSIPFPFTFRHRAMAGNSNNALKKGKFALNKENKGSNPQGVKEKKFQKFF